MCGLCGNGCSAWDWETTGYALLNGTELEVLSPAGMHTELESHPRSLLPRFPSLISAPRLCTDLRLLRGSYWEQQRPPLASSGVPKGLFRHPGMGMRTLGPHDAG